jgi:hypothetical protein
MGKDANGKGPQIPQVWPQVQLKKPDYESHLILRQDQEVPCDYSTPNDWFNAKFPKQSEIYGPSILELTYRDHDDFQKVVPIEMNTLFFAGALGGQEELGHKTIFYPPDGQFYFIESANGIFHPTTEAKLQNLLSAYMVQCAASMPCSVAIQTLFIDFRKPEKLKAVVDLAKSVLAVDESFFGKNSPVKRVHGIENSFTAIRAFIEESVQASKDDNLIATAAYLKFLAFCSRDNRSPMERKDFLKIVGEIIREKYGLSIRHDLKDADGRMQQGWKGLKLGLNEDPAVDDQE